MTLSNCATGTALAMSQLVTLCNLALSIPKVGTHVGVGTHCNMPPTWDGSGNAPEGWTSKFSALWTATALVAAVIINDSDAALLQLPGNLAKLTAPQAATLNAAIAGRTLVDLDAGGYVGS